MKISYVAEDGTSFDSEQECLEHESDTTLYGHVNKNCPLTYNDDVGFSFIEPNDVVAYILMHIYKINELVKITNAR